MICTLPDIVIVPIVPHIWGLPRLTCIYPIDPWVSERTESLDLPMGRDAFVGSLPMHLDVKGNRPKSPEAEDLVASLLCYRLIMFVMYRIQEWGRLQQIIAYPITPRHTCLSTCWEEAVKSGTFDMISRTLLTTGERESDDNSPVSRIQVLQRSQNVGVVTRPSSCFVSSSGATPLVSVINEDLLAKRGSRVLGS